MSGIEVLGALLAFIPSVGPAFRVAYTDRLSYVPREYRRQRFSLPARVLSWLFVFDTDAVQEMQRNINTWTDDEVLSWKASYIDSCNAIAVAGAIFATIGLAALAFSNIATIQWSARALLTASTVFGILSVVSATSQHRTIGLINEPRRLRFWLSRGRVPQQHRTHGKFPYPSPYDKFVLDSSVSAMLITQFPRVLLNIAMFLYLVGFGLYTLFSWLEKVPADADHTFRNIFIVFIVTLGACAIYLIMCGLWKILEDKTLYDDFNFQRLGIELPYDKELDKLGRKDVVAPAIGVDLQPDLLHAIRALSTEVARLREATEVKKQDERRS